MRSVILADSPNENYTVRLEGEVDSPGIYAPILLTEVGEIFEANMEIVYPLSGDTQRPAVSWSGFGTLQYASAMDGVWVDLPEAENPYVITPEGDNARFYRLKQ